MASGQRLGGQESRGTQIIQLCAGDTPADLDPVVAPNGGSGVLLSSQGRSRNVARLRKPAARYRRLGARSIRSGGGSDAAQNEQFCSAAHRRCPPGPRQYRARRTRGRARLGSGCRADSWPAGASRWRQQSVWVLRVRASVFLTNGDRASGVKGTHQVLPDTGEIPGVSVFKFRSDT